MLEAAGEGLWLVLQWPAVGYLFLGVLFGLYCGAVPGLSGLTGLVILLPFTFTMDPVAAFAVLLGMLAVTTTSDTIPAVLLGVPGTAAAQATILDGYPMAQRGEAARAFGAAFTSSAVGGVFGALTLVISIPLIRPIINTFASPEFFMLGVLGLAMVGSLSGRSMTFGLLSATLGLLVSMIGFSPQGGQSRFAFGQTYLLDGLDIVPVVMGIFAIPELATLIRSGARISTVPQQDVRAGMLQGIKDAWIHRWLLLRCSALGAYIGILPALGAAVADWVAYGHAVQSAKDKSQFGKGDVRGVIGPESANNSVKGGDLIPTIAFGIPGSGAMAILLGAFLIQGLTPGPEMLGPKLPITFSMVWTLVIANILGAIFLMLWTKQISKIVFLPGNLVAPAVAVFIMMGAWSRGGAIGDLITLIVLGVLGIAMKGAGWPRAPFALGFVLGPIMESSLDISLQSYGWEWVLRPASAIIGLLVIGTIVHAALSHHKQRKAERAGTAKAAGEGAEEMQTPEREAGQAWTTLFLAVLTALIFIGAAAMATRWTIEARFFPMNVAVPGILLGLGAVSLAIPAVRRGVVAGFGMGKALRAMEEMRIEFRVAAALAGVVLLVFLFGQKIAFPVVTFCFLRWYVGRSWRYSLIYAGSILLALYVIFTLGVHTIWYDGLVPAWLGWDL